MYQHLYLDINYIKIPSTSNIKNAFFLKLSSVKNKF